MKPDTYVKKRARAIKKAKNTVFGDGIFFLKEKQPFFTVSRINHQI